MTKYEEWDFGAIDLFVGGTPCQSFSVAGLRKGLDDPRGNLMLTFGAIANRFRPRWLVWENVPGVLSSNGGRDFGSFLGMLGKLGYGFAYRVLDAQYFGVAQRRRRVFVVGHFGDWRRAAAVLFERHSLQGHPAPSRETRKDITECAGTLTANGGGLNRPAGNANELDFCVIAKQPTVAVQPVFSYDMKQHHSPQLSDSVQLTTQNCCFVRGDTPLVQHVAQPIGFNARQDPDSWSGRTGPLDTDGCTQAVAFAQNTRDEVREMPYVGALAAQSGMKQTSYIRTAMQVRRLTPVECERLQGFPDNYTNIPKAADGPRYKALGNSMAVPVMRWIGKRIQMVEA
jgi:DNA (cytosine-5)-methyltransferase 1